MSERNPTPHHPLPRDARARHDRLPESIVDERDLGDDAPDEDPLLPDAVYRDPQGRPYRR